MTEDLGAAKASNSIVNRLRLAMRRIAAFDSILRVFIIADFAGSFCVGVLMSMPFSFSIFIVIDCDNGDVFYVMLEVDVPSPKSKSYDNVPITKLTKKYKTFYLFLHTVHKIM